MTEQFDLKALEKALSPKKEKSQKEPAKQTAKPKAEIKNAG